jgi:hypothetical protein
MYVLSSSLTLPGATEYSVPNVNNPVIGYEQLVTTGNIDTRTEEDGYPATNLANPSTNLKWTGVLASPIVYEYIDMDVNTELLVDYVAISRHNFGTGEIAVSLWTERDGSPSGYNELIGEFTPTDDTPLLMRFTPQAATQLRVRLLPSGAAAPTAAVVYAGRLLVLPRRIYVGHTPLPMGRKSNIVSGRSESGDFLGRVVLSETLKTSLSLNNLDPAWVREYLNPFILSASESPFFFAWRPGAYPDETAFAWLTDDPALKNATPNGFMSVTLNMAGVAE